MDTGLQEFWRRLRTPPDTLLLEVGAGGELLVAKLRAILSLLLLLLPLFNLVTGEFTPGEGIIGLVGTILAVLCSQLWLLLARQPRHRHWLPWVTTTYDISLTTLVLALLALDSPVAAINSMVVWAFYLMAILMTALRNDGRLTLYAGALSLLQYGTLAALVLVALTHAPEQLLSVDYGSARLSNILQRELLIAITTAITSVVVFRMQHLVELSGNDGLTGLPNRTLLIHRFPDLIEAAQATGRSLSLGLIDLDYFRRVNDEAGHAAGDQALRHVVRILGQRLEESDWLVRLGGEEFALVLPLPAGSAWEKLDRLRLDVAATPFQPETGAPPIRLTFSAGIASWPHDGMELSQLLRRADLRLRQAKLTGRNRVVARDQ